MSLEEEKYTKYLREHSILPRLMEILDKLVDMKPLPKDPLMDILNAIGCPLIPQAQMKELERKVTRAQEELRYLRRILIDLGGQDELYDSDTDENEYVGHVGPMGAVVAHHSPDAHIYDEGAAALPQYRLEASISIRKQPASPPAACGEEQQPCSSRAMQP
ncbi:hypothetical protein KR222_004142 [Zaprionus bogoriensis]|nr:hypothetical protein KR222_004142 [Zaprionus bogoriensis]